MGIRQRAEGRGQRGVGSGQWAVESGQLAIASEWTVDTDSFQWAEGGGLCAVGNRHFETVMDIGE